MNKQQYQDQGQLDASQGKAPRVFANSESWQAKEYFVGYVAHKSLNLPAPPAVRAANSAPAKSVVNAPLVRPKASKSVVDAGRKLHARLTSFNRRNRLRAADKAIRKVRVPYTYQPKTRDFLDV